MLVGQNAILQYLIEQGCDVDRYDMYNISPLQVAVKMGNLDGVKLLMRGLSLMELSSLGLFQFF